MKKLRALLACAVCAMTVLTTACGGGEGGSGGSAIISTRKASLSHGSWSGTTYTSEFLGIKGEFGSDWEITDDKTLADAYGLSDMSAESMKSALGNKGLVQEMMAAKGQSSVNIMIEDTTKTKTPTGDKYFSTMLEIAGKQFEALGLNADVSEGSVTYCGENTRCMNIVLDVEGTKVYEIQVPVFVDNYIVNITFAATSNDEAKKLIDMFSKL